MISWNRDDPISVKEEILCALKKRKEHDGASPWQPKTLVLRFVLMLHRVIKSIRTLFGMTYSAIATQKWFVAAFFCNRLTKIRYLQGATHPQCIDF